MSDKIFTILEDKLDEVKEKINYLKNNSNDFQENNLIIFFDKINNLVESIDDEINSFEVDEEYNIDCDELIKERIENNKKVKETLNIFGPYILLYQILSQNTNN